MKLSIFHVAFTCLLAASLPGGVLEEGPSSSPFVAAPGPVPLSCTPSQTCSGWRFEQVIGCCANRRQQRLYSRSCTEVTYYCEIHQWGELQALCDGSTCG